MAGEKNQNFNPGEISGWKVECNQTVISHRKNGNDEVFPVRAALLHSDSACQFPTASIFLLKSP